ncbi:MAG TPA: patatin-like phospholipase family protein, partial [Candidatus Dormibacteraeota bacterium]|nr:patatin-like phospholipase family protein [Candidatus Dormibacteraeota bacterium]
VLRLEAAVGAPPKSDAAVLIAVFPAAGRLPEDFIGGLEAALRTVDGSVLRVTAAMADEHLGPGSAEVVFDDPGNARIVHWFDELEATHGRLLLECDATDTPWTRRCLREADVVLLVADATSDPSPKPIERAVLQGLEEKVDLVLVHPEGTTHPTGTARWLEPRQVGHHYHVLADRQADLARVARYLTGRALGLALSGGGARGFAHVGVMRALEEAGHPIDFVGGTSMGALIGGLIAMGLPAPAVAEQAASAFKQLGLARDWTLPLHSLVSARRIVLMLKGLYGDLDIEDLWIPYFCCSANLTRAELAVHRSGPLWLWVRASSSVPGIEPPVVDEGSYYIDGGILNNLPGDIMRGICNGTVVAVNVSPIVDLHAAEGREVSTSGWSLLGAKLRRRKGIAAPSIMAMMARSTVLASVHNSDAIRASVDLYLHPPTDHIDAFAWDKVDEIADVGYQFARQELADWEGTRRED